MLALAFFCLLIFICNNFWFDVLLCGEDVFLVVFKNKIILVFVFCASELIGLLYITCYTASLFSGFFFYANNQGYSNG